MLIDLDGGLILPCGTNDEARAGRTFFWLGRLAQTSAGRNQEAYG
jgi:hypothetical protein